jgi:NADH pyrophosphatase NudC (nudix superfamily)
MIGFHAVANGGAEPRPGDGELSEVRWFGRDEVEAAAQARAGIRLPPRYSISRRLIDCWLAG